MFFWSVDVGKLFFFVVEWRVRLVELVYVIRSVILIFGDVVVWWS